MAKADRATYGGDPENSDIDKVRLLVGDTDCSAAYLLDSEIAYFITECGGVEWAAPRAAEAIAAKLTRKVDFSSGQQRQSLSKLQEQFFKLAARLEARAAETSQPYAGNMDVDDNRSDKEDTDLRQPYFEVGQFDNPRADTHLTSRDELLGE